MPMVIGPEPDPLAELVEAHPVNAVEAVAASAMRATRARGAPRCPDLGWLDGGMRKSRISQLLDDVVVGVLA
jgi:hypothetical protein